MEVVLPPPANGLVASPKSAALARKARAALARRRGVFASHYLPSRRAPLCSQVGRRGRLVSRGTRADAVHPAARGLWHARDELARREPRVLSLPRRALDVALPRGAARAHGAGQQPQRERCDRLRGLCARRHAARDDPAQAVRRLRDRALRQGASRWRAGGPDMLSCSNPGPRGGPFFCRGSNRGVAAHKAPPVPAVGDSVALWCWAAASVRWRGGGTAARSCR